MTAPSPARPGASSRRLSRSQEQRIARTLLVVTFAFAFVVQNGFFEFSNSINGDIDYTGGDYLRFAPDLSLTNVRIYELLTLARLAEISTRIPDRAAFTRKMLELCERRFKTEIANQRICV